MDGSNRGEHVEGAPEGPKPDSERYDWLSVDEADFFPYEYVDSHLPEGMGLMVSHGGGMCEHRTGTLMSPEHLRKYILPWYRKFADMAHGRGSPWVPGTPSRATSPWRTT